MNLDPVVIVNWLETMVILIVAITFHEFGHAIAADRLGDNTPRSQGRISVNPVDHLDPMGTLMMAVSTYTGFGIGWGKPVQYNPGNLRRPRWDPLIIAIAGPITNVIQALLFAVAARLCESHNWVPPNSSGDMLLRIGVLINLSLVFFNLIPIPPLDGSKVLSALLPIDQARAYDRVMGTFGLMLFFVLAFTGVSWYLIGPPVRLLFHLLTG